MRKVIVSQPKGDKIVHEVTKNKMYEVKASEKDN